MVIASTLNVASTRRIHYREPKDEHLANSMFQRRPVSTRTLVR
jgi:hypothetical protein